MSSLTPFVPSIHPAYARLLIGHLHSQGFDIDTVFEDTNLDWDGLLERQRFISFSQFSVMADRAFKMTECPWLGLEISSIIQVSSHGPLGYGAIASKNLRQAIGLIESMMPTRILIYEFGLIEGPGMSDLRLEERLDVGHLSEFIQVMLFGSFMDLLEKIGLPLRDGIKATFSFPEPEWLEHYHERFPAVEFSFGAEAMAVSMPTEWLDSPCLTADLFAYKNALRECEALLGRDQNEQPLSRLIIDDIVKAPGSIPSLDEVSTKHALSSRTLIRKLKSEGTNYQQLVDEVRQDIATWSLLNTDKSIEVIAEDVGFQDTSNFSRVFRRWYDITPSEFRRRSIGG